MKDESPLANNSGFYKVMTQREKEYGYAQIMG